MPTGSEGAIGMGIEGVEVGCDGRRRGFTNLIGASVGSIDVVVELGSS